MKSPEPNTATSDSGDETFSRLLEAAAESIIILDQQGKILWANRKTCELFGYPKQELIGQSVDLLVPERLRHRHAEHREKYLSNPRNRPMGKGLELAARRKDGSEFPVEISLTYKADDGAMQVMAIISDVTAFKQAEAAREQMRKWQLEQKEEEIRTLERLSRGPKTSVTANLFDTPPLREYSPTIFCDLVGEYCAAMDLALERRIYKTEHPLSEKLRNLAEQIGFLKGTPRDVVEIHRAALKQKSENSNAPKVQGYVEEGHLLLVELMGYLASRYRNHAIETRYFQGPEGMK